MQQPVDAAVRAFCGRRACVRSPTQAQRQLRKGSALRRSATVRQRVLHKERVIYHINNTSTINSNSNSNINCLICLICFKVHQGCLRVLGFARLRQKSCAPCPAGTRAQAQRQLRRALSCARDRRQPMSISNLFVFFYVMFFYLIFFIFYKLVRQMIMPAHLLRLVGQMSKMIKHRIAQKLR